MVRRAGRQGGPEGQPVPAGRRRPAAHHRALVAVRHGPAADRAARDRGRHRHRPDAVCRAADERPEDFDGKSWKTYNVLPDAMLVNWQSADFVVRPGDDGNGVDITIQPFPRRARRRESRDARQRPLRGRNRRHHDSIESGRAMDHVVVTGRLSASCAAQIASARDHAAGAVRLRHVRDALAPAGRRIQRRHAARADAAGRTPAADARVRSRSPRSCASRTSISSNVMARTLLLALAAEMHGTPATTAAGPADHRRLVRRAAGSSSRSSSSATAPGLSREALISGGQHGEAPDRRAGRAATRRSSWHRCRSAVSTAR